MNGSIASKVASGNSSCTDELAVRQSNAADARKRGCLRQAGLTKHAGTPQAHWKLVLSAIASTTGRHYRTKMDQRIEDFLADVLALQGETPDAIREGVRVGLADCEATYRAQETNRRMKDKAAHAAHSLCRNRVAEEMRRRKGTPIAEHLKLVLSIIEGPQFPDRES